MLTTLLTAVIAAAPWTPETEAALVESTVLSCLTGPFGETLYGAPEPYAVALLDNRTGVMAVDSGLFSERLAAAIESKLGRKRVKRGQTLRVLSRLEKSSVSEGDRFVLTLALFKKDAKEPLSTCAGSKVVSVESTVDARPPQSLEFQMHIYRFEPEPVPGALGWGCAETPADAELRARIGAWLGMHGLNGQLIRTALSKITPEDRATLEHELAASPVRPVSAWSEGKLRCVRALFPLSTLLELVASKSSLGPGTVELVRASFLHASAKVEPLAAAPTPSWTKGEDPRAGVGSAEAIREPDRLLQAADARAIEALQKHGRDPKNAGIVSRWFDPRAGRLYSMARVLGE
ncbi:MAG: hypothetical protein HYV07_19105 [Deltaproteobacteria bacterium]|nr:hypothetical protein [Deltaproteobacteria bacterium]